MSVQLYKSIDGVAQCGDMAFDSLTVSKVTIKDLKLADSKDNIRIDASAGASLVTGFENTLIGKGAAAFAISSNQSVIMGSEAGQLLSTGSRNNLVGSRAGLNLTAEGDNCIMGYRAAEQLASNGERNVLIGNEIQRDSKVGSRNVCLGWRTALSAAGSNNSIMGYAAAPSLDNSSSSVIIGSEAAPTLESGDQNIIIGPGCAPDLKTGSNNILIGYTTTPQPASLDNQLRIGNLIEGDLDVKTLVLKGPVTATGSIQCPSLSVTAQDTMIRSTSTPQSILSQPTWTTLTGWDIVKFQKGLLSYSLGGSWTINRPGVYILSYSISFAADSSNSRAVAITVNNTIIHQQRITALPDAFETDVCGQCVYALAALDVVQIQASQSSASGPLDCTGRLFGLSLLH